MRKKSLKSISDYEKELKLLDAKIETLSAENRENRKTKDELEAS